MTARFPFLLAKIIIANIYKLQQPNLWFAFSCRSPSFPRFHPFHPSFSVQDRIFCAFSSCTVSTKKARLPQKAWRPEGAEGIRVPFQTIGAMLAKKPGQMSLVFGPFQISVVGSYLVSIMKDQYSTESSWRIRKPPTGNDSPFLILFPHITFLKKIW